MKRTSLFLIGLAAMATASPANASVTFTTSNSPQPGEELVAFADQAAATTITGVSTTTSSNTLALTGTTTTGTQLVASSGHVLADTGSITSLTITPSSLLDLLILNTTTGSGTITYSVLTDQNNIYTFSMSLGIGSNFLTIDPDGGEYIQSVSLSAPGGFTDARSFAAIFVPAAVPEPISWALILLGFGAMGLAIRRQKRLGIRRPVLNG